MGVNYKDLLDNVKLYVVSKDYNLALKNLEQLLIALKKDFQAGINREKSGKAFNRLLPVREELKNRKVTKKTFDILGLAFDEPKKVENEPKPEYSIPSNIFDGIDIDDEEKQVEQVDDEASKTTEVVEDPKKEKEEEEEVSPEDAVISNSGSAMDDYQFEWDELPTVKFEDIAGLEDVKELIRTKVLFPLLHPESLVGYESVGGGGLCLYGPPGTGKTMMAAAIANKINAKFCTVVPSDLLHQGAGNSEKAVRSLFAQARRFKCAVIFFDEMDSIAPKSTRSQYARQLRSELLAQLQGIQSYGKKSDHILFLICATNKPWDIDSAFLRPGRFGTKVYVSLPDEDARRYIINHRLEKIREKGAVKVYDDINVDYVVEKTNGFNCSDITNLLSTVEEISFRRVCANPENKYISNEDFLIALKKVPSTVQLEDIIKLNDWKKLNDVTIGEKEENEWDNLVSLGNDDSNQDTNDVSSDDNNDNCSNDVESEKENEEDNNDSTNNDDPIDPSADQNE